MKEKKYSGFTLIELLIVMGIIGVLSALALVALSGARKQAKDSKRKADLEQIRSALEMYRSDLKDYPLTASVVCSGSIAGGGTTYMAIIPCDPGGASLRYLYNRVSPNVYYLCADLELGSGSVVNCSVNNDCTTGTLNSCNYQVRNP